MQKITSRKKLCLYGCSGLGVNMLTLVMGSYLCSALLTGGFDESDIGFWTFSNSNLVIAAVWSVMVLVAKILDGVIDIPLSSFTDRLRTRWGRRRPSILIGLVPTIAVYCLFLVPLTNNESIWNTIWFGVLLCLFYTFYTLTMLTYYATFSEITQNESDMTFLSNVKSICDVVYFSLGYALIPLFISLKLNIRIVALIFLPLALSMLIPLFLLKEKSTRKSKTPSEDGTEQQSEPVRALKLGPAIACAFKDKVFLYWMLTAFVMNIGLQLFLGGINELFSSAELNQTIVMASSFAPVPFTIFLYNKLVKKYGLGLAFKYILVVFSIGMIVMFLCGWYSKDLSDIAKNAIAITGGIFASFAIGAFFSVSYLVPSRLAQIESEKRGVSVSSMYFAVEGLVEGIAAGIATGPILVFLKQGGDGSYIAYLPIVVAAACMIAFGMSFAFPKNIAKIGRVQKSIPALDTPPTNQPPIDPPSPEAPQA